jgi:CheY-like chemotaxis protein
MPLCNGLEATSQIRKIEETLPKADLPKAHQVNNGRIPILAVSASVYDSDVGACIYSGMDGFVNKPVNVKLLHTLLQSSTDSGERQRHVLQPNQEASERKEGAWFGEEDLQKYGQAN